MGWYVRVYPLKLSMTPGILLAPRFSKDATVAAALQAKTKSINSVFGAVCVVDIDCSNTGATKYTAVKTTKEAQAVSDPNAYAVGHLPRWATRCTAAAHWRRR